MKTLKINPKFQKTIDEYVSKRIKTKEVKLNVLDEVKTEKGKLTLVGIVGENEKNEESFSFVIDDSGKIFSSDELTKTWKKNPFIREDLLFPILRKNPVTISPNINDLILNLCDSFGERLTVTIPKNPNRNVDIYFLADTTGSMGAEIENVKNNINSIMTSVNGAGLNIAFGAGNYKDFPNDTYCFKNDISITTNQTNVSAAVNTWTASGGSDLSEGQLFALTQIADSTNIVGWRNNSLKIIVWFGDAPGHDPICTSLSSVPLINEGTTTSRLQSENIRVLAISTTGGIGLDGNPNASAFDYSSCTPSGAAGQATRITTATQGNFLSNVNASDIANAIANLIANSLQLIHNVQLIPTGQIKPFICSINPSTGYHNLDSTVSHSLTFIVCFKGVKPCGKKDQFYKGTFDVIMDGVVVAQKKVLIEVPACKSKGKCQCGCCN